MATSATEIIRRHVAMASAGAEDKRINGAAHESPMIDAPNAASTRTDTACDGIDMGQTSSPARWPAIVASMRYLLAPMTDPHPAVLAPHRLLSRERLQSLLSAAHARRVVVVGDAMLDVYLRGDVDRISPEAPVPVVRVRERREALGGAGNVAQNIGALGAEGVLVAAVGDDRSADVIRSLITQQALSDRGLITVRRPTTAKTRVLARSQQVVRVDEEDDRDLDATDIDRLLAVLEPLLANADALVLEDYNKGVLLPVVIDRAIALARGRRLPVIVDPKYRHFFAYRGATIFKPNRRELESALGAAVDLTHADALPHTFARLGVEHLLLTLGEQGMALVAADGVVHRIPTTAREVYDVVGAGDTVTAYLATMLAAGATVLEASIIANYAAGVEVGKLGAQTVSADEVLDAYDHHAAT
jgi:D-glycero-beta-D-manno-heptose-7-phosphate kinase